MSSNLDDLKRFRQRTEAADPDRNPIRTSDAIAEAMFDACLNQKSRRILRSPPALIILQSPTAEFAPLVENSIFRMDRAPAVEAITERNRHTPDVGAMAAKALERGQTLVLVSQDPVQLPPGAVVQGADLVLTVPAPDAKAVRRAIRRVTGHRARGLRDCDVAGLSLLDMLLAIRPGLAAGECVRNLRRASQRETVTGGATNVPLIEDLPLTRNVDTWARESLDLMRRIGSGEADPSELHFTWFEGPPGTGKTTIAGALARSAGWQFCPTSMATWFQQGDGHLGAVIKTIKSYFDGLAGSDTPVVGFIDEIDSLPSRAAMDQSDASWWTPVVNCVLTEIDRIRKSGRPVLLLGATNHAKRLDPALVRSGRLETMVSVRLPDEVERKAMFARHLGDVLADDDLGLLARLAVRYTPAAIEGTSRSAQSDAQREGRPLVLRDVISILDPPGRRSRDQDWGIALHEAGHAVVAIELGVPVQEISIIGSENLGGFVSTDTSEMFVTRQVVESFVTMFLGGRASDEMLGAGANAGAAADIEVVNRILRQAIVEFGLYGSLTDRTNTDIRDWNGSGHTMAASIRTILDDLHERAIGIVLERQDDVVRLAERLMSDRVLSADGIHSVLDPTPADPLPPDPDPWS